MQSSNSIPPILRLDSDVWSSIAQLAPPNVLIKLSLLSPTLNYRIKQGSRALNVFWTHLEYIELAVIFGCINQYPRVTQVSISSEDPFKLHWRPANWSLLPARLTTLSLRLTRSICSLLGGSVDLRENLPNLTALEIIEAVDKPLIDEPVLIRLDKLPSSLLRLCVISSRLLPTSVSDLEVLPASLEVLTLDCGLKLLSAEFGSLNEKRLLPAFPPSLRELRLNLVHNLLHVDLKALPSSLRLLHFKSGTPMHAGPFDSSDVDPTFEGSRLDLPLLEELRIGHLSLTVAQAFEMIPSSTTRLEVNLTGINPDNLTLAASIVAKITHFGLCNVCDNKTVEAMFSKQIAAPKLEHICVLGNPAPPSISGPTLKKINTYLPSSLKTLNMALSSATMPYLFNFTYPRGLTSLKLNPWIELNNHYLTMLPSSLELIYAHIPADPLALLFSWMPSRFPHLRSITVPVSMKIESLTPIPDQLEELSLILFAQKLGLSERVHSLLQGSKLRKLIVNLQGSKVYLPGALSLLRALPSKLISLELSINCRFTNEWPVVFPSTLTHISIKCRPNGSFETYRRSDDPKYSGDVSHPVFPPTLQSLELSGNGSFETLPSHLSRLSLADGLNGNHARYFALRKPFFPQTATDATLQ